MALISYELGLSAARREGRSEGKAELLEELLTVKFGTLPTSIAARIASASDADLAIWAKRVLAAVTLDSVFERS